MSGADSEMKIDAARAKTLVSQLQSVSERIAAVSKGRNVRGPFSLKTHRILLPLKWKDCRQVHPQDCPPECSHPSHQVRLVAVSKLKPANDILALHQPPVSHVHFGENYQQELRQKAEILPKTIQWHFIGGLQSGKFARFLSVSRIHPQ